MNYSFHSLGDNAVLVELGTSITSETHRFVQWLSAYLEEHPFEWMIEYIPAFTTISIFYDPVKVMLGNQKELLPNEYVCEELDRILSGLQAAPIADQRVVEIPVCYGGEMGTDLEFVAKHNQLTPDEVIEIHSSSEYTVYMIGFAPGFPYLGGLPEKIAAPRRETPRLRIPPGSVGIAGMQTGVYPLETPGGWQLIGRTPVRLFRPEENPPSLLRAGDRLRFIPINQKDYIEWEKNRK